MQVKIYHSIYRCFSPWYLTYLLVLNNITRYCRTIVLNTPLQVKNAANSNSIHFVCDGLLFSSSVLFTNHVNGVSVILFALSPFLSHFVCVISYIVTFLLLNIKYTTVLMFRHNLQMSLYTILYISVVKLRLFTPGLRTKYFSKPLRLTMTRKQLNCRFYHCIITLLGKLT